MNSVESDAIMPPDHWAGLRRAAQRVIDAIGGPDKRYDVATAAAMAGLMHELRCTDALATPPEATPVATPEPAARVLDVDEHETVDVGFIDWIGHRALAAGTLLYAGSPPMGREREGLTQLECEMLPVWQDAAPWSGAGRLRIVRAIEALHGIGAPPAHSVGEAG